MSSTEQEKTINGLNISVSQLPAMKGAKFSRTIMGVFAGALPAIMLLNEGEGTVDDLPDALGNALSGLSEDKLELIIKTLFNSSMVDYEGNRVPLMPVFDLVFQGKILTMYKFLYFAIQVNYSDFLEEFLGRITSAQQTQKQIK